ncbi:MAG: hypothetical protein DMG30_02405 [Acidobacteria bacterium]|nr:MAG: hypothetical protein DMG30_02405 [Acidobacteriota bacterium]
MNSTATSIRVNIVDGGLQPLPPTSNVLVHVRQGATDTIPPQSIKGGAALLVNDLEFHDNFMDTYTVIAYADGYQQAGTFVAVKRDRENPITLMLVKGNATFRFQSWDDLKRDDLEAVGFLVCEGDEASARANYERVAREHPEVLASLLNLIAAMRGIKLGDASPLVYFKQILWDSTMAQDRFFGYVDPAIIPAVRAAADTGHFAEEKGCAEFHPGATCSYKQIDYDVANVQLTFHEDDTKLIDGVKCVKIEPDIDYYKDLLAHGLGEVIPNKLKHQLTNPVVVYGLRYNAEGDEFDPGYAVA